MSIVEAGGFSVLSQLLEKERDPKLFQNYLAAMRNLSDADIKFVGSFSEMKSPSFHFTFSLACFSIATMR